MYMYTVLLATKSTDLLEGPQNKTCFFGCPLACNARFSLSNRYISLIPVYVFPVPEKCKQIKRFRI